MQKFAIAALAATTAYAQWQWSDFPIEQDGDNKTIYVRTAPTSVFNVDGRSIGVEDNKAVFMMTANQVNDESIYKPELVGGCVETTVDISEVPSGCVSGLYLVATDDDCTMDERDGKPNCANVHVF